MTNLVILSSQAHRGVRIAAAQALRAQAQVNMVGVVPREFQRLLAAYPIFFTKSPESNQYEPAVLLGFELGENLFFANGTWEATYIPLQLQRQPFALITRPTATADPLTGMPTGALDLALDMDSPAVQAVPAGDGAEGEPLFNEDGSSTQLLQNVSALMSALVSGAREAYAFTAKLAELNLLEPVQVDLQFIDGTKTQLQGLYWINGNVLKALEPAQLADLRDREYLEWLYFQMASLAHLSGLVARKNRQISAARSA